MYSTDLADYMTLCQPCHRVMDLVEGRPQCTNGHNYIPENTGIKKDGSRNCRRCSRERMAERLKDPEIRARKNAADREYWRRNPMTPDQRARKTELQRVRRAQARKEAQS